MKISRFLEKNKTQFITVIAGVILMPLVYSTLSYFITPLVHDPQPFLEKPDAKYESCVRDTAYMRVHHMDYLKEIREEVVRYGKRGEVRLSTCAGCHTSRERFCNQCHNTVNLTLDCFGCHYYPEPDSAVQQVGKGGQKWTDGSS